RTAATVTPIAPTVRTTTLEPAQAPAAPAEPELEVPETASAPPAAEPAARAPRRRRAPAEPAGDPIPEPVRAVAPGATKDVVALGVAAIAAAKLGLSLEEFLEQANDAVEAWRRAVPGAYPKTPE
ncbi:MAG TPA: hypothetical protein VEI82_13550, partial [Myxococcota bacterium]|nr:hypothetical protein [Myxococcota bacterium]